MGETLSKKTFVWPVRVYYEDTDSGGVVYYANYLKFMERARTEWLRTLGVEQDALLRNEKIIFAVRRASVEYVKPARFNDELLILTSISAMRRVSITFEHNIYLQREYAKAGERAPLLCSGVVEVASLDGDAFKPTHIPSHLVMELKGAD